MTFWNMAGALRMVGAVSVANQTPRGVEQLCAKYSDVFKEELGTIRPFQGQLKIDERAKPKFCKARTVFEMPWDKSWIGWSQKEHWKE